MMPRFVAAVVVAAALSLPIGCTSSQHQARQEAARRWNLVRAEVKARLAADQLAAGDIAGARGELAAASGLAPDLPGLSLLQARLYMAQGEPHEAEAVLKNAPASEGRQAAAYYLRGVIRQQRGRWSEALTFFARAAEQDHTKAAYLTALANTLVQIGRPTEALDLLNQRREQLDWSSDYQAALAECCEQIGRWDAAAAAWQSVADERPEDLDVRERLAIALYRAGRFDQAIPLLSGALAGKSGTQTARLQVALADCLQATGRTDAAREQLAQALRSAQQETGALRVSARLLVEQGDFRRAYQTIRRAVELDGGELLTLELAAALAYRVGDRQAAAGLARRLLRKSPGEENPVAQAVIESLNEQDAPASGAKQKGRNSH